MFLLIGLSCTGAAYYGVVWWRVVRSGRVLPTTRDGLRLPPPESGWPSVCIVVPAHNEEVVIGALARSLMRQDYPALRIVFALDRCTDRTEEVLAEATAGAAHVELVRISECPEGWAGKTHAAWRGVQDSEGAAAAELLLFTDADTEFDPGLVRASVALLLARGLGLLSLLSRLTCEQWFEKLVQPAAGFELVRQYPLDFVNRDDRPRAFANGQFMLFRRDLYDQIGGHERVKAELLEDIALARYLHIHRRAIPNRRGVYMTDGMLRCRMYRDWDGFRRGWKRIFTESSGRKPRQLKGWSRRKRLFGTAAPAAAAVCAAVGGNVAAGAETSLGWIMVATGMTSLAIFAGSMSRLYRDQGVPARWVWLYPIGAWRVADLLREAARDLETGVKTVWAGREYTRVARESARG